MSSKTSPVIVITGTPGTGKSTHAQLLAAESPIPLNHINIGDWVKEKNLYEEYDEEWQSYAVDEDKVHFNTTHSYLMLCFSLAYYVPASRRIGASGLSWWSHTRLAHE